MSTATTESTAMGRSKGRPKGKQTERNDVAVKIDRALVAKAKLIAADQGISVAKLLSDILQPAIDKAYGQLVRKLEP